MRTFWGDGHDVMGGFWDGDVHACGIFGATAGAPFRFRRVECGLERRKPNMRRNRTTRVLSLFFRGGIFLVMPLLVLTEAVRAQTPDEFNPTANGLVSTIAVQRDGKVLVGGVFTTLGGQTRQYIGRLNGDGTLDGSFNPGSGSSVFSLAVQRDGKVLVGGSFNSLGGQTRYGIGRLSASGALDTNFNPGAGVGGTVRALAVQADGGIFVGGTFSTLGGQNCNYIGRLRSDGALDAGFNAAAGGGVNTPGLNSLVIQADGKIVVCGDFRSLGGQACTNLGRLNSDGTLDTTFNGRVGGMIYALGVQADGRILTGGTFTNLSGQSRTNIGRLNGDGTIDSTFNSSASGPVYSLAVQTDGMVLVGGSFTNLCSQACTNIGRLDLGGTLDPTFHTVANDTVYSLALQVDGRVLAGGYFSTLAGQTRSYIGRLSNTAAASQELTFDGTRVLWLRGGTSPEAWRTWFDVSTDGATWTALGPGLRTDGGWQFTNLFFPHYPAIRAQGSIAGGRYGSSGWLVETISGSPFILLQPTSQTNNLGTTAAFGAVAGGSGPFSYQWLKDGQPLSDGARVFGSQTPALSLSNVFGGDAGGYSVVVSNTLGHVTSLVAGLSVLDPRVINQPMSQFTNAGQTVCFSVAAEATPPLYYQWRKGGVPIAAATASSLTLTDVQWADGGAYDAVVSNAYGTATSTEATLAFPSTADSFSPGVNGSSPNVYSLAVQTDGKILVGGYFNALGGQSRTNLGRLSTEGAVDVTFDPGASGNVYALALLNDGKIIAGGAFTSLGGQSRTNLGRLNPDGTLDSSFSVMANGTVNALAAQADGKILVGGAFNALGGQNRTNIGRLNAVGDIDGTFSPVVNNTVDSMVVQTNSQVLVGGFFTSLCGQTRNRIGRLNADGTLDTNFNPGANNAVNCLALQADGKIVAGGTFTTLGGQTRNYIGRLNVDGTLDSAFNPGANGIVYSLAVQTDGKIIVGGAFTTLGGQTRSYIGRLNADGSLDPAFNPGANNSVFSVALQADGKVLAGGYFTSLGGQSRSRIGRLNNTYPAIQELSRDGSTLTWRRADASPEAWQVRLGFSTNGMDWSEAGPAARISGGWQAVSLALPPSASMRACGSVAGAYQSGSAWLVDTSIGQPAVVTGPASRTNLAGTLASFTVLGAGTAPLSHQWCKDGTQLEDGAKINGVHTPTLILSNVLGGDSGDYVVTITNTLGDVTSRPARLSVVDPLITGQPASQTTNLGQTVVFQLSVAGTAPMNYQWRKNGTILTGATMSSLTLTNVQFADGGNYHVVVSNAFGSLTSAVAALAFSSAADSFNPGASGGSGDPSYRAPCALAPQPDGKIVIGGNFTTLGGRTRNCIGRVNADGSLDSSFDPGADFWVLSLAVQADTRILVGGLMNTLAGQQCGYIGRLNADGTLDSTFNARAGGGVTLGGVYSILVQPDGKILVGGDFRTVGGQACTNIGRLNSDGALDPTFKAAANDIVYSLAMQPDGRIVVGGSFTNLCGQPRSHIGRLNADGTLDGSFSPGIGDIPLALVVQPDGKFLVGGGFVTLCGQTRNRIGRLNSDGTLDTLFNPGASGIVRCLVLQADGGILVGGEFTTLGGLTRNYVGRMSSDGTLDATFNPGANNSVFCLTVQADGQILAGGIFSTLGGQPRSRIGRLSNTCPAFQDVSSDASTITWLRAGASPEVWRARFDVSINGLDWLNLSGTRINGGWQVTNLSLPAHPTIRARGFVASARYNASGWFVETNLGAPGVISGPASLTNNVGTEATFSVVAAGLAPLGYQWWKDGSEINGANMPSLSFPNVQWANGGSYRVVITNATGAVTSSMATLSVNGPDLVLNDGNFGFHSNRFGFDIGCMPNQAVVVEATTNLLTWMAVQTNVVGASGLVFFADPECGLFPYRFYRARMYDGVLPRPAIAVSDSTWSIPANGLRLSLSGVGGQGVLVEASTNLLDWTLLSTNTLGNGPLYLVDPEWTNFCRRFYRLRVE